MLSSGIAQAVFFGAGLVNLIGMTSQKSAIYIAAFDGLLVAGIASYIVFHSV